LTASGPNPSHDSTPSTNPDSGLTAVTGTLETLGALETVGAVDGLSALSVGCTVEDGAGLITAVEAKVSIRGAAVRASLIGAVTDFTDIAGGFAVLVVGCEPDAAASVEPRWCPDTPTESATVESCWALSADGAGRCGFDDDRPFGDGPVFEVDDVTSPVEPAEVLAADNPASVDCGECVDACEESVCAPEPACVPAASDAPDELDDAPDEEPDEPELAPDDDPAGSAHATP
jgi:hypothetical protein